MMVFPDNINVQYGLLLKSHWTFSDDTEGSDEVHSHEHLAAVSILKHFLTLIFNII